MTVARLLAGAVVCGCLAVSAAHAAAPEPLVRVGEVRARGCDGDTGALPALRPSRVLDAVARQLWAHEALEEALQAAHTVVDSASAFWLPATASTGWDPEDCRAARDPEATEIGLATAPGGTWVVVARPFALPTPAEAAALQTTVLNLLNAARAAGQRCGTRAYPPSRPLAPHPTLTRLAVEKSWAIVHGAPFEHADREGVTLAGRARQAGFHAGLLGENLGVGIVEPAELVAAWLASPGHCANVMDGQFNRAGLAIATSSTSEPAVVWTLELASAR